MAAAKIDLYPLAARVHSNFPDDPLVGGGGGFQTCLPPNSDLSFII